MVTGTKVRSRKGRNLLSYSLSYPQRCAEIDGFSAARENLPEGVAGTIKLRSLTLAFSQFMNTVEGTYSK